MFNAALFAVIRFGAGCAVATGTCIRVSEIGETCSAVDTARGNVHSFEVRKSVDESHSSSLSIDHPTIRRDDLCIEVCCGLVDDLCLHRKTVHLVKGKDLFQQGFFEED